MLQFTTTRSRLLDSVALIVVLLVGTLLAHLAYQASRSVTLSVDSPSVMLPLTDFHALERLPDTDVPFRWTQQVSNATLPNPGDSVQLELWLAGGQTTHGGRSVATVLQIVGGSSPVHLTVQPELRHYSFQLPATPGERLTLQLQSDVFTPDERPLGISVTAFGVSGGGGVPQIVLLAFLLASAAAYLLLRCNRVPRSGVVLLLIGVQCAVLWWQTALGGWTYGLLVSFLLLSSVAALGAVVWDYWLQSRLPPALGAEPPWPPLEVSRLWLLAPILLLALAVRLPWLAAPDPVGDMELAARRMSFLYADGLAGAYSYDGDYMPLRLYLLALLSQFVLPLADGVQAAFHAPLPFTTKLLVKLPGLLADAVTIGLLFIWAQRWLSTQRAALVALLYALLPPVWMNVAWWGQVDALLALPLVGMVVLLDRSDGRWSWCCWTVALLIKPQAIVLAPLLYVATLRLHGSRGVLVGGTLAVSLFALVASPLALAGQGPGMVQAYVGSVGRFPWVTAGAYNLWYLVTQGASGLDVHQAAGGLSFRLLGLLLVGSVALTVCVLLLRRADGQMRSVAAAVLALAFFALPTQIHERYLFLALPFLALALPADLRLVVPLLLLALSNTLNILGTLDGFIPQVTALIEETPLPFLLATLNLAVLAGLLLYLGLLARRATPPLPHLASPVPPQLS